MSRRSLLPCASHFGLCPSVEGVQFAFQSSTGNALRAVVLAEVLESRYGARRNEAAWLEAFMRNETELVLEARRLSARSSRPLVIIMMSTTSAPMP